MTTGASRFVSRAAIAAAVFGVAMLGNLRSQASEAPVQRPVVRTNVVTSSVGSHHPDVRDMADAIADAGADVDGGVVGSIDDADDGGVVPAIYAWDPDVRFVYYRHVSKWM